MQPLFPVIPGLGSLPGSPSLAPFFPDVPGLVDYPSRYSTEAPSYPKFPAPLRRRHEESGPCKVHRGRWQVVPSSSPSLSLSLSFSLNSVKADGLARSQRPLHRRRRLRLSLGLPARRPPAPSVLAPRLPLCGGQLSASPGLQFQHSSQVSAALLVLARMLPTTSIATAPSHPGRRPQALSFRHQLPPGLPAPSYHSNLRPGIILAWHRTAWFEAGRFHLLATTASGLRLPPAPTSDPPASSFLPGLHPLF